MTAMNEALDPIIIRGATRGDARAIAEILVGDWQTAYRGIIDDEYLDAMSVKERAQREAQRYRQYVVAERGGEVLGFAWNELSGGDAAEGEIVALYVRYAMRGHGIGKALFRHAAETFRAAGCRRMIVWCLKGNEAAGRFYERMGGKPGPGGTHPWGSRDYEMVSWVYRLDGALCPV